MSRTGSQCAERHHPLVAQALFSRLGQAAFARAQGLGHLDDKIGDQHGTEDKTEPHAEYMQVQVVLGQHGMHGVGALALKHHWLQVGQRLVITHQQRVAPAGENDHVPGIFLRQHGGGNHQRQQEEPRDRVGGAAGEIENGGNGQHVEGQLNEEFVFGDRLGRTQSQPGPPVEQGKQRQNAPQRHLAERNFQPVETDEDDQTFADDHQVAQHKQPAQILAGVASRVDGRGNAGERFGLHGNGEVQRVTGSAGSA